MTRNGTCKDSAGWGKAGKSIGYWGGGCWPCVGGLASGSEQCSSQWVSILPRPLSSTSPRLSTTKVPHCSRSAREFSLKWMRRAAIEKGFNCVPFSLRSITHMILVIIMIVVANTIDTTFSYGLTVMTALNTFFELY